MTPPIDRSESASLDALVRSSRKNGSLDLRGGGGSTVGDTMQVASAGWQSLGAAPVHRILPSTAQSNRPRRRVRLRLRLGVARAAHRVGLGAIIGASLRDPPDRKSTRLNSSH